MDWSAETSSSTCDELEVICVFFVFFWFVSFQYASGP